MLADNRFQYGIDFSRQQGQQQGQHHHHFIAQEILDQQDRERETSRKSQPQIITKDLTLSSTKYHSSSSSDHSNNDENDDNDDEDMDMDVDVDVDVDMDTRDMELLNADADMVGQTDVTAHTDADDAKEDTDGQSTLHLPHARWPNHWSNTNTQLSETTTTTVTYKWLTSPWSECSQKCGSAGSGLRRRTITCVRINLKSHHHQYNQLPGQGREDFLDNTYAGSQQLQIDDNNNDESNQEIVDNAVCEDYGLDIPDTFETCGTEECPHWVKNDWSLCHQSRCFGRNTAIQKREVSCRFANESVATTCAEYEKPISRQECYNERCRGVWRVEPWSECNAPCGRQGIKYRVLQCVWYGTRRPAGNACKHQTRPAVMKVCKSPPCYAKALQHCKDTSRYCRNVRSMGLCRLHRYQEKCCKSCKYNSIPN